MKIKNYEQLSARKDDLHDIRNKINDILTDRGYPDALTLHKTPIMEVLATVQGLAESEERLPKELRAFFVNVVTDIENQLHKLNYIQDKADHMIEEMCAASFVKTEI